MNPDLQAGPGRRGQAAAGIASIVMLGLLCLLSPQGAAVAVENGTLGIRPQTESDFLFLNAKPGGSVTTNAVVSNLTAEAVVLDIYPVDAQSTDQGSFAMAGEQEARAGIGAWTTLAAPQITVEPNSELVVGLTIDIPPGTPPGDYAGGVIIQSPPVVGETSTADGNTSFRVDVVQRQGLRIYFTVEGTAEPGLTAGELSWDRSDDGVVVTLPITNTGNVILYPTAMLTGVRLLGSGAELAFATPESILPGESFDLRAVLAEEPLFSAGSVEAQLNSDAGMTTTRTFIAYAPWWLMVSVAALLLAASTALWLTVRFIRRARRALARQSAQDAARSAAILPGDRRPRGAARAAGTRKAGAGK